jgi:hypothetical protein
MLTSVGIFFAHFLIYFLASFSAFNHLQQLSQG